jgi:anti-sigma factor RsiW
MTHDETRDLIDAYVDGELDLVSSREVKAHLEFCADCRQAAENIQKVRSIVQNAQLAYRAPSQLRRNIRTALRREDKASSLSSFGALAIAAACALVILAGLQFMQRDRASGSMAEQVVASHVRSLLATHLVDVASSDQHTVKPWFDGKLDFAPPVKDFASQGFPLEGGRLDYFNGAPAAALVYQHNKHPINLFIQPAAHDRDTAPSSRTVRGYNLFQWSRGGFNYWAVSDLNTSEFGEFVRLSSR